MASLADWFTARDRIRRLYQEELGRDVIGDPDALTNWLYHAIAGERDDAWIRARIQDSTEWQQKHGGGSAPPVTPQAPPSVPSSTFSTGVVERADSLVYRPRPSAAEMARFIPRERGPFQFPAPYNVRGIRVTDERDGPIVPVGYSYWPNASFAYGFVLVFCANKETGQLLRFVVNPLDGRVQTLGPLPGPLRTTGEGFYFIPSQPTKIYGAHGPYLSRFDLDTGEEEIIIDMEDRNVWQVSSSDDGTVHAGTLRDGSWRDVGIFVSVRGQVQVLPLPEQYDECHIDKTGRWLHIEQGQDNRILDLQAIGEGYEGFAISNANGAVSHVDMGAACVIGEDDMHEPGALVRWRFPAGNRELLYHRTQWKSGLGHVAVRGDRIMVSNASVDDHPRVNDLVLVDPSGSLLARVVCPNLMDLTAGGGSWYELQPKANIDPTGRWACWTANCGTDRLDVFLVELP